MHIQFYEIIYPEGIVDALAPLKEKIENQVNLSRIVGNEKRFSINQNKIMRICFLAGLSQIGKRDVEKVKSLQLAKNNQKLVPAFFTHQNLDTLYSALIKMRYHDSGLDLTNSRVLSRIIGYEILRGNDYLMLENNLESFLYAVNNRVALSKDIPVLNLLIGNYGDEDMEAKLDINSRSITNSQIIIAGATGSGKTNLLAVLMQQFRALSSESRYPVNFLLFDYKGEFSDIANNSWLTHFDVDRTSLLDPMLQPLPFTPFKDFTGRPQNEINLYSTEMASALSAIDRVSGGSRKLPWQRLTKYDSHPVQKEW